jgi:hypothetical protein
MVDVSHPLGGNDRLRAVRLRLGARWSDGVAETPVEISRWQIGALFVALSVVTSIPIVLHPWPPLTDYINHLARMHVIAAIGNDPDLARFYEINWQIIPNLMMDLIVPLLGRVTNIYLAGQIYAVASFVLILSGTLALNRQLFGRWSVLPLIAAPLLYNQVFLVGTMNYISAIGLALWSLTVWVWLRERGMVLRLTVSALSVLALFFCHLYAVGAYGIGLLAYELCRLLDLRARSRRAEGWRGLSWRLLDFAATGLPFLPVLPLLMISPTWGLRAEHLWEFNGKLDGLLYVVQLYFPQAALLAVGAVIIAAVLAVYGRVLKIHPFGWMLLGVGTIVYLAMPRIAFDTYMADQRLPVSLVFMLMASGHLDIRRWFVRHAFAAAVVGLLALRILEVQTVWNETSRISDAFRQSMHQIERGSRVLVAYAEANEDDNLRNQGLVHGACLAIIERSSLVTTAFTVVGKQILRARSDYRDSVDTEDGTPPTVAQLLQAAALPESENDAYWSDWTADYDYVFVLFTRAGYENPDPARLTAAYLGDKFVLYRIMPPQPEPDPQTTPDSPRMGPGAQVVRVGPEVRNGVPRIRQRNRTN